MEERNEQALRLNEAFKNLGLQTGTTEGTLVSDKVSIGKILNTRNFWHFTISEIVEKTWSSGRQGEGKYIQVFFQEQGGQGQNFSGTTMVYEQSAPNLKRMGCT